MSDTDPRSVAAKRLRALLAEIEDDLLAVSRLAQRLIEVRDNVGHDPEPAAIMATAGFLHHIYTAMESVHERIVRTIDGAVPTGERWHQELLTLAGLQIDGVRTAIIGTHTRAELARLLRFRHLFRHAYRIDLLWDEVSPLLVGIDKVVANHRAEVTAFCADVRRSIDELERERT